MNQRSHLAGWLVLKEIYSQPIYGEFQTNVLVLWRCLRVTSASAELWETAFVVHFIQRNYYILILVLLISTWKFFNDSLLSKSVRQVQFCWSHLFHSRLWYHIDALQLSTPLRFPSLIEAFSGKWKEFKEGETFWRGGQSTQFNSCTVLCTVLCLCGSSHTHTLTLVNAYIVCGPQLVC